jgi:peptidoglycan/xylan/chitin deacetylase (PgdA/CDA1 family)
MKGHLLMIGGAIAVGLLAPHTAAAILSSYQPATPQPAQAFTGTLDPHPIVALTFDDLPAAGSLPQGQNRTKIATTLAAELKANHLEGTYGFVNAVKLENDPDAQQSLRIWVDAGMNLGNHTWSHTSLTGTTVEDYEREIARDETALAQYAGERDWHWFRYPFLTEGETLEKRHAVRSYLGEHGYRVAQVTLDFEDYAWNDAYARCSAKPDDAAIAWLRQSYLESASEYIRQEREEERIVFGHEIPSVMLLHGTAFTTLMLPELIDLLRKEGFRFDPLAKVEQDRAYAQDPDVALEYGDTLSEKWMNARHLNDPPVKPKPFEKLKNLCR